MYKVKFQMSFLLALAVLKYLKTNKNLKSKNRRQCNDQQNTTHNILIQSR